MRGPASPRPAVAGREHEVAQRTRPRSQQARGAVSTWPRRGRAPRLAPRAATLCAQPGPQVFTSRPSNRRARGSGAGRVVSAEAGFAGECWARARGVRAGLTAPAGRPLGLRQALCSHRVVRERGSLTGLASVPLIVFLFCPPAGAPPPPLPFPTRGLPADTWRRQGPGALLLFRPCTPLPTLPGPYLLPDPLYFPGASLLSPSSPFSSALAALPASLCCIFAVCPLPLVPCVPRTP